MRVHEFSTWGAISELMEFGDNYEDEAISNDGWAQCLRKRLVFSF